MMLSRTIAYASPSRSRMSGMHSSARSPDAARSERTISATLNVIARLEAPGFAAGLAQEPQRLDRDALVEGLGHVVDRQCGDAGRHQRFELDAGPRRRAGFRLDAQRAGVGPLEGYVDLVQRQRMGQGNERGVRFAAMIPAI